METNSCDTTFNDGNPPKCCYQTVKKDYAGLVVTMLVSCLFILLLFVLIYYYYEKKKEADVKLYLFQKEEDVDKNEKGLKETIK